MIRYEIRAEGYPHPTRQSCIWGDNLNTILTICDMLSAHKDCRYAEIWDRHTNKLYYIAVNKGKR